MRDFQVTPDFIQPYVNQTPAYDNDTPRPGTVHIADRDQAKPLLKIIKRMLQPRHPKNKRFTKPRARRKTGKEQYYS